MKFENTRVMGFEGAFRGMRNPMESWNRSDSFFDLINYDNNSMDYDIAEEWTVKHHPDEKQGTEEYEEIIERYAKWLRNNGILRLNDYEYVAEVAYIGPNDMELAQKLIKSGSEHRKFMRQIFVSVDITASQYYWNDFDTYKVGTVANSTSKMHKLASTPIDLWNCFEMDDFSTNLTIPEIESLRAGESAIDENIGVYIAKYIDTLEEIRKKYLETKDKRYWKELIRWLPESWLQTRTVTMTYENLFAMCSKGQRRFHKLNEWSGKDNPDLSNFISWARTLPYAQELIFIDELEKNNGE